MDKWLRNLFLVIFLFPGMLCSAQDSLFLSGTGRSFIIQFNPSGSASSAISNEMLRDIAEARVKNLRNTAFKVNYGIEINVTWSPSQGAFEILFHRNGTGGDDSYRGFPLSDALFPDSVGGEISVYRKSDGTMFPVPFRVEPDTARQGILRITGRLPSFNPSTDTIVFDGLSFIFTKADLQSFHDRVSVINDYYACAFVTDTLLAMVQSMEPPAFIPIDRLFIFLEETGKFLQVADQRQFALQLGLESFDPENFRDHFRELSRYFKSASMTFGERVDGLARNPGEYNSAGSPDDLMKLLVRYIRWSFLVNERNSAVYQDFLDRFWSAGVFDSDTVMIKRLIAGLYPGANIDSVLHEISSKILSAYRRSAEDLTGSGRNAEALMLLDNQQLFTQNNPWMKEEPGDRSARIIAEQGIYHSYLAVASSALSYQKPELAESYLEKAMKFRAVNHLPVGNDSLYRDIYDRYISLRLGECDTLAAGNGVEEAIECYLLLRQNIDSASFPGTWQSLGQRLSACRYRYAYDNGMNHYLRLDYAAAARFFFEARKIRRSQGLPAEPGLDSLCGITSPWYLTDRIRSCESLIWNNRLEEAKAFADSIDILRGNRELYSDSVLNTAIRRYRVLITEKICWNTDEAVSVLRIRAERAGSLKNYPGLCSLLDSAIALSEEHPECGFRAGSMRDTLEKYSGACAYQMMIESARNSVILNSYDEAVRKYSDAEDFYQKNRIGSFGLPGNSLLEILKERALPRFTLAAFKFYLDKEQGSASLECLKILRSEGYPEKDAKPFQSELAKKLAASDFTKDPLQDPYILLQSYTGADQWFARFRYVFMLEWKSRRYEMSKSAG